MNIQNSIATEARPDPAGGSLQGSPDPLAVFKVPNSKGKEGEEGKGREMQGQGKKRGKGGKRRSQPPKYVGLQPPLLRKCKNCTAKKKTTLSIQINRKISHFAKNNHRECCLLNVKKVKVKFSHTRYRALGPELIPVYRQSARR